jgi:hypothetical protein
MVRALDIFASDGYPEKRNSKAGMPCGYRYRSTAQSYRAGKTLPKREEAQDTEARAAGLAESRLDAAAQAETDRLAQKKAGK